MNTKQEAGYKTSLENAQKKFDAEVSELAEKIRTEVIIPLCKKHKLTFLSGMGRFFFTDAKGHDYEDPWPLASRASKGNLRIYNETKPVLLLLNEEVSHNQVLGYYVEDVK